MKKPTKQRVIKAVKSDHEYGKKRLIEAVELRSGVMIVEYECRQRVSFGKKEKTHVSRRLIVEPAGDRGHTGSILHSHFEEDE